MIAAALNRLTADLPPQFLETMIALLVAIAVLVGAALLQGALARARRRRAARLARVGQQAAPRPSDQGKRASLRAAHHRPVRGLMRLLPRRELLRTRLQRAGFPGGVGVYLAVSVALAVFTVTALLILRVGPPAAALIGGLGVGIALPHAFLGWRAGRREAAFLKNLPEGVDIIVRGLKAGLPVSESMAAVGREAHEPVGGLFREIGDLVRIGHPLEAAIERTARRMAVPELRFLAITLSVQKETGGNLTETLENLSEILRKRRQMKLKIRAVSSEARASAYIIGSLPFVMFCIIWLVNQPYVMELFTDPRGHIMIGVGLGSILFGALVMAKMVRFDI
ncbi:MAG: type II secretion system F family protein [Marivibrio sp.]|uniref:type II secretion system F family protein n=1 Tax=Marivibrio sp. TaxID=2039719 RepID=UPI0032EEF185